MVIRMLDGQLDGCVDEQMSGWVDESMHRCLSRPVVLTLPKAVTL